MTSWPIWTRQRCSRGWFPINGGLRLPKASATSIVGAYGGLVYLSAILGAWVADRLFGAEPTLLGAAVPVMIGHLSLAPLPGLGDLCHPDDERRVQTFIPCLWTKMFCGPSSGWASRPPR